MREIMSMPVYMFFYIMFCIIHVMKKHYTLLYHVCTYDTKRSRFEPGPPSPLFVATTPSLDDATSNSKSLCHFAQFRLNTFMTEAEINGLVSI